jgi:hypothetical protein
LFTANALATQIKSSMQLLHRRAATFSPWNKILHEHRELVGAPAEQQRNPRLVTMPIIQSARHLARDSVS